MAVREPKVRAVAPSELSIFGEFGPPRPPVPLGPFLIDMVPTAPPLYAGSILRRQGVNIIAALLSFPYSLTA